MRADFLAHVFWGVLDNRYRHLINPLSPKAEQARYMNPENVWLPGTRPVHMDVKMVCNEQLMNVSVPQWLEKRATAEAGYQSVGKIKKYQGG